MFPRMCVYMRTHLLIRMYNTDVCVCVCVDTCTTCATPNQVHTSRVHTSYVDIYLPYIIKIEPIDYQMFYYFTYLRNRKSGSVWMA